MEDQWVYLDTNFLIDLVDTLSPGWKPSNDKTSRNKLAVARVFFYGRRPRCDWFPVVGSEGRRELETKSGDWTAGYFLDVDMASDSKSLEPRWEVLRNEYQSSGLKEADARHLAAAVVRPWVHFLITSDEDFRRKAGRIKIA